ncbi:MAG: ADP-ribosylglycohydrolase family protein [Planctomycetales bacterium]|nr:ADP-ribosylglycohydrolase family protein [Planctomycetales bacterium]
MTREQFEGGLLGLALGDAFAAPYEGGWLERSVWLAIGTAKGGRRRWTDDTQMSLDLAASLIDRGDVDLDDISQRFANGYRWSRGYGSGAAKVLKRIRRGVPWREASTSVYPGGSFGNGGAMRSPVIGMYFAGSPDVLEEKSKAVAMITHAHPLAQEAAYLIALATATAMTQRTANEVVSACLPVAREPELQRRLGIAHRWLSNRTVPDAKTIKAELGNGVAAVDSVVTALYLAAAGADGPFESVLDSAIAGCGDTDTIAAMACAIWGAAKGKGALPVDKIRKLERADEIQATASRLHAKSLA